MEKFFYYAVYLVGTTGKGHVFIETDSPIDTKERIDQIHADIERDNNLPPRSVSLINWKRID